jgi:hypothetical protein
MAFISSQPDWKPLYEAALFETDESKMLERIAVARSAILDRIEETLKKPVQSENRAMDDALRHLRRLLETTNSRSAA